jgi:hypothetical protein
MASCLYSQIATKMSTRNPKDLTSIRRARPLTREVPPRLSFVLRAAQTLRGLLHQRTTDVRVHEELDSALAHLGVG